MRFLKKTIFDPPYNQDLTLSVRSNLTKVINSIQWRLLSYLLLILLLYILFTFICLGAPCWIFLLFLPCHFYLVVIKQQQQWIIKRNLLMSTWIYPFRWPPVTILSSQHSNWFLDWQKCFKIFTLAISIRTFNFVCLRPKQQQYISLRISAPWCCQK